MAKIETSATGSQVFLSSEAQSQLKTMQRKLATLSDENWDKYASKGGQSRVVTLALTALDERLEKSPDTSHGEVFNVLLAHLAPQDLLLFRSWGAFFCLTWCFSLG